MPLATPLRRAPLLISGLYWVYPPSLISPLSDLVSESLTVLILNILSSPHRYGSGWSERLRTFQKPPHRALWRLIEISYSYTPSQSCRSDSLGNKEENCYDRWFVFVANSVKLAVLPLFSNTRWHIILIFHRKTFCSRRSELTLIH